jgi:hypothetical protein
MGRNACFWGILATSALGCTSSETDPEGTGGADAGVGISGSAGTATAGSSGSAGTSAGDAGSPGWSCGSRSTATATLVNSTISEDTTWSGTVLVQGDVDVVGATLSIAAGTHVIFAADASLEVGWNSSAATLLANGTAAAPVTFCGQTGDAGYWKGLIVGDNVTTNSFLRNVLIADAGGDAQALRLDAAVELSDVQVENSARVGVRASAFGQDSARLSVTDTAGVAVTLTSPAALSPFPLGGEFTGNTDNSIHLDFDSLSELTVVHDAGIPYVLESAVDVSEGAELTFEAGVEVRFEADAGLDIGWNSGDVVVHVEGTSEEPVLFRGVTEEAGYWEGISIGNNVRTSSTLSHLVIRHAGGGDAAALRIEAAIHLDEVRLEQNARGAWIGAQGLAAAASHLSITSTEGVPLTVQPDALVTLPTLSTFTGNTTDHIAIEAGDFHAVGSVPNLGVPYRVLGDISTMESSAMTIAAGTSFIMTADSGIEFGWNSGQAEIHAEGTDADPIRFIGLEPSAGYWAGLTVGSGVLSSSKFDYVRIENGGPSCLTLQQEIDVTHSSFNQCGTFGIRRSAEYVTDYEATNTFTDMGTSAVGDL